jgi:hypothetical protein
MESFGKEEARQWRSSNAENAVALFLTKHPPALDAASRLLAGEKSRDCRQGNYS